MERGVIDPVTGITEGRLRTLLKSNLRPICKTCKKCNSNKPSSEFGKRKAMRDGLKSWCKSCECKAAKERRLCHPERTKLIDKKSRDKARAENPEKACERNKLWRERNKQRISEKNKERYKDPEYVERKRILALRRARELGVKPKPPKEPDHIRREKQRIYMAKRQKTLTVEDRKKISEYKREWMRNRRLTDISFRIQQNCQKRIWDAVRGNCKSATSKKLIGCSSDDLRDHLSSQFTDGMTLDNYGEWHVDHIRPCSSFDLSIPSEQEKCFHFSNLQPLWAIDNLRKSDKYDEEMQMDEELIHGHV
jgi:hypothetical protein